MEEFICKECNQDFKSLKSLSQHRSYKHDIKAEQTYIEYELNGEEPTCACGCGNKPNFLSITKGYREYILGHASRVSNNWGHNPEAIRKSHETQKKMFESGELEIWNKGLTKEDPRVRKNVDAMLSHPDRNKKISEALRDVPKSEDHKEKLSKSQIKSWSNPEKRKKQRDNRMKYMINNDMVPTSKLEDKFEEILIKEFNLSPNVDFYRQFYVRDIKGLFDFKISGKNILIEVDGDFWHCNPNSKFKKPTYEAQKNNVKKDRIKDKWCKENNYTLIRFWEDDINNNLDNVINILKLLL